MTNGIACLIFLLTSLFFSTRDVLVCVLFAYQNFLIKSEGIVIKYSYEGFTSALIGIQTEK